MSNYILNKGFHNTVTKKAVPCNLIQKLIDAKDELIQNLDAFDYEYYEDDAKEDFDALESGNYESYTIGSCIIELLNMEGHEDYIERDVEVYTTEMYSDKPQKDSMYDSKYIGIEKLPNGADIIGFQTCCEEKPTYLLQYLYYDGEKLRIFTPYEGNAVDIVTRTALQDEYYKQNADENSPLCPILFPDGVDVDLYSKVTFTENGKEYELAQGDYIVYNYMKYFGANIQPDDYFDPEVDASCIDAEIESVLC